MAEKMIKHLLFSYGSEIDNPMYVEGEEGVPSRVVVEGLASIGSTVDITRQYDLVRGEEYDAFFTDEEKAAIDEGTYDGPLLPALQAHGYLGGQSAYQGQSIEQIEAMSGGGGAPIDVASSSAEEIAEFISTNKPNVSETVALAQNDPDLAEKVLDAEVIATESDPRTGVENALEKVMSSSSSPDEE